MRHALAIIGFTIAAPLAAQAPSTFTLTSAEIAPGSTIKAAQAMNSMGCTGQNVSPSFLWKGAPANVKSFALTMYDPDAPTGSGFWHWVVYNIPANATKIAAGAGDPAKKALPEGSVQGNTDMAAPGYVGPCPPVGDKPHHYVFTLYALDAKLEGIPANATAAYVGFNIHGHTLGKATFTALYSR